MDYYDLHGEDPQRWELGVKEVWEVPKPLDRVIHTMGWPLRKGARWNEFGGSFIYPMGEDKVCIGFVAGLDYTDATFSVHDVLQQFKTAPVREEDPRGRQARRLGRQDDSLRRLLRDAAQVRGAGHVHRRRRGRAWSTSPTLKGIHYAMHAGMYAAEAIVDALKKDSINFEAYDKRVRESVIGEDIYRSRNMRQPFSKGFFVGGAIASAMTITRGAFPSGHWKQEHDAENEMVLDGAAKNYPKPDGKYTFDKLSSVFASGNATRDDAPNHIRVQTEVPLEVAQTWVSMCPAQVYEIPEDQLEAAQNGEGDGTVRRADRSLELRAVRRDHRQGRAPDAARGRRRAAVHAGLAAAACRGAWHGG